MGCGSTESPSIQDPDRNSNSQKNKTSIVKSQALESTRLTSQPAKSSHPPIFKPIIQIKKPNETATKLINDSWALLLNQQKPNEALYCMMKATEQDPECYETWYNAGMISKFHVKEQNSKSLELFRKAVALNPEHKDSNFYYGVCLIEEKRGYRIFHANSGNCRKNKRKNRGLDDKLRCRIVYVGIS